jgi:transcriptional regulator with XRE-family HTH domain
MPQRKKTIRHDEIVARFGQRLRELRLARGMSQAELARQAEVTTNYISRLEGGGAAPGIDLVARLASALGVPVADLLPTTPPREELFVLRERAQRLFDSLLQSEDRAVLLLVIQLLARLAQRRRTTDQLRCKTKQPYGGEVSVGAVLTSRRIRAHRPSSARPVAHDWGVVVLPSRVAEQVAEQIVAGKSS